MASRYARRDSCRVTTIAVSGQLRSRGLRWPNFVFEKRAAGGLCRRGTSMPALSIFLLVIPPGITFHQSNSGFTPARRHSGAADRPGGACASRLIRQRLACHIVYSFVIPGSLTLVPIVLGPGGRVPCLWRVSCIVRRPGRFMGLPAPREELNPDQITEESGPELTLLQHDRVVAEPKATEDRITSPASC